MKTMSKKALAERKEKELAQTIDTALLFASASDLPKIAAPICLYATAKLFEVFKDKLDIVPPTGSIAASIGRAKPGLPLHVVSGLCRSTLTGGRVLHCTDWWVNNSGLITKKESLRWTKDRPRGEFQHHNCDGWVCSDLWAADRHYFVELARGTQERWEFSESQIHTPLMISNLMNLQRRAWNIDLSIGDKPHNSIRILSLPANAKEFFKLREKPEGRDRRSALLHAVKAHQRAAPSSEEDIIEIKRYLRGSRQFEWFGMNGSITPSEVDEELLSRA